MDTQNVHYTDGEEQVFNLTEADIESGETLPENLRWIAQYEFGRLMVDLNNEPRKRILDFRVTNSAAASTSPVYLGFFVLQVEWAGAHLIPRFAWIAQHLLLDLSTPRPARPLNAAAIGPEQLLGARLLSLEFKLAEVMKRLGVKESPRDRPAGRRRARANGKGSGRCEESHRILGDILAARTRRDRSS